MGLTGLLASAGERRRARPAGSASNKAPPLAYPPPAASGATGRTRRTGCVGGAIARAPPSHAAARMIIFERSVAPPAWGHSTETHRNERREEIIFGHLFGVTSSQNGLESFAACSGPRPGLRPRVIIFSGTQNGFCISRTQCHRCRSRQETGRHSESAQAPARAEEQEQPAAWTGKSPIQHTCDRPRESPWCVD